jgi:hypothetical protein
MKRFLIGLAVVAIIFDTIVSVLVVLAYLGFCHAGLTIGPPFNGFGKC